MTKALLYIGLAVGLLHLAPRQAQSQTLVDRAGNVRFFSKAPVEDIEATTQKAECVLILGSGQLKARIPMADFAFERELMRQHYNEKYLHTAEHPYATLTATCTPKPELGKDGPQALTLTGNLTMHGVTRPVTLQGTFTAAGQGGKAHAVFPIQLADYNIKIPTLVIKKIAETVEVTVDFNLNPPPLKP